MVRLSLRWRVAVASGIGSLLLTGMLAVVTWHLASDYMLRQRTLSATRQADVNARLVETELRSGAAGLDQLLTGLSTDPDATVLLVGEGTWVTSGRRIDPAALPEPLLALARDSAAIQQRLIVGGVPVLAVALPVEGGRTFVELFPLVQLSGALRFLSTVFLAGTVLSGLLGVGLGLWTSRRALRPLAELTTAASRVAAGDLDARLPERDDPDLTPLATTFNATAAALQRRVQNDARFAGDVSHELRSPLTTMVNAIELLRRRRSGLSETAARAVELLDAEVHRFQQMVVDLLEISRDDQTSAAAEQETLDLHELAGEVLSARPHDPPRLDGDGRSAFILGDRRRLSQVVTNLLDNADRHGGGAVRVAVCQGKGTVRLEVDDEGPGVPESMRQRIFERFARGAHARLRGDDSGTGLGLALVSQHVARHHGRVWVEDRPGGGARFVVELPRVGHRLLGGRPRFDEHRRG